MWQPISLWGKFNEAWRDKRAFCHLFETFWTAKDIHSMKAEDQTSVSQLTVANVREASDAVNQPASC